MNLLGTNRCGATEAERKQKWATAATAATAGLTAAMAVVGQKICVARLTTVGGQRSGSERAMKLAEVAAATMAKGQTAGCGARLTTGDVRRGVKRA